MRRQPGAVIMLPALLANAIDGIATVADQADLLSQLIDRVGQ